MSALRSFVPAFVGRTGAVSMPFAVTIPIMIRCGLAQTFSEGFKWYWLKDFVGRVWLEILLVLIFMQLTGMVLMVLGMGFFCVGAYPAMGFMMLAYAQVYHQLYELYLERGGEAVPLKEPATA